MTAKIAAHRNPQFRPLADLYRDAWKRAGHPPEQAFVGLHNVGSFRGHRRRGA